MSVRAVSAEDPGVEAAVHPSDERGNVLATAETQGFERAANRYRLTGRLAGGAQSAVWRARDTLTGRDVVIKRVAPASSSDRVARRRIQAEADAVARISHPNTLPLLDTTWDDDELALVFPYVPGETLAQHLGREKSLAPHSAARIALHVADALAAAHAAGVVHRDVKPGNILLGGDAVTRLIDFGISRTEGDNGGTDQTGSGMAVGTLPYMSPEQLTGSEPSPSTDVFALGVVLYEMLAGRRPFRGGSPAEQLELHGRPPERLRAPAPLVALVYAALDPRPERRPAAGAMSARLREWLEGRPAQSAAAEAATAVVAAAAAHHSHVSTASPARPMFAALVLVASVALAAVGAAVIGTAPPSAADAQPASQPSTAQDAISPGSAGAPAVKSDSDGRDPASVGGSQPGGPPSHAGRPGERGGGPETDDDEDDDKDEKSDDKSDDKKSDEDKGDDARDEEND